MCDNEKGCLKPLSDKQVFWNLVTVGFFTFLGRVVGLVKDALLARFLGIGATADAFWLAYRVPNILRSTFAEGSIPGAMVPLASKLLKKGCTDRVRGLATLVSLTFLAGGLLLWLVVFLWPERVVKILALGFDPSRIECTASFLVWFFPLVMFFSLCSIFASLLQAAGSFNVNAVGPCVFNLVWIVGIVFAKLYGGSVHWVITSVLVGGLFKLAIRSFFLLQRDLWPTFPNLWALKDFCIFMKRMGPLLFGIFFSLLSALVETQVGSFLPKGHIALMHYCFRFFNLVLYTIAVPIDTILLLQISRVADEGDQQICLQVKKFFRLILLCSIPFTVLVLFFAKPFCRMLLGFSVSAQNLSLSANLVRILFFGLSFDLLSRALTRIFYALGDTKTPTFLWGASVVLNSLASIFVVLVLKLGAVAVLSCTVSCWFLMVLSKIWMLRKKYGICLISSLKNVAFRYNLQS